MMVTLPELVTIAEFLVDAAEDKTKIGEAALIEGGDAFSHYLNLGRADGLADAARGILKVVEAHGGKSETTEGLQTRLGRIYVDDLDAAAESDAAEFDEAGYELPSARPDE